MCALVRLLHQQFVAMVTPEDMKANAQFIQLADFHVDVPGIFQLTFHVPCVA